MHAKMQVFLNQPWLQMHASLILLFGKKQKLCLERTMPNKNRGLGFSMKLKATSKN